MTQIPRNIKLEPENWQTLAELAKAHGVSMNALIGTVLKVYVLGHNKRWKASGQWGGKRIKREAGD